MPTDDDSLLHLGSSSSPEDIGEEVEKTNTELEKVRRHLETIERQKARLEELRRRQDDLESGREEMGDKLTRALGAVEREHEETQRRLEQLAAFQQSFTQHIRYIDSINPKAWDAADMPRELSTALSAIDSARADYTKAQAKLATFAAADDVQTTYAGEGDEDDRGFLYWMRSGFAFTLPMMLLALVLFIVWFIIK